MRKAYIKLNLFVAH